MLVLWLPPCITDRIQNSVPGECKWEPSLNKEFVIIVASIGHHGSCFIMLFCYIRVFLVMRKQRRVVSRDPPDTSGLQNGSSVSKTVNTIKLQQTSCTQVPEDNINHLTGHPTNETSDVHQCIRHHMTSDPANEMSDNATSLQGGRLQLPDQRNGHDRKAYSQLKHKTNRQKRDRKVFITLTYILIAYIICWVPFHFVFDVSSIDASLVPDTLFSITFWLTYINSTVNPFLYNFSCSEFRATFTRLLCKKST